MSGDAIPTTARLRSGTPVRQSRLELIHLCAAIPQNWLVNPEGKLEWEQTGFTVDDTKWQEGIVSKIEELLKRE